MKPIKLPKDITEEEVVKMTLERYHVAKFKQETNEAVMKDMKFPYGTLVVKKGQSRIDVMMGNGIPKEGERIGIVVGSFLLEDNTNRSTLSPPPEFMYRVHYDNNMSYIGEHESHIEVYDGPIPEHLKDVTWNNIYFTGFNV